MANQKRVNVTVGLITDKSGLKELEQNLETITRDGLYGRIGRYQAPERSRYRFERHPLERH